MGELYNTREKAADIICFQTQIAVTELADCGSNTVAVFLLSAQDTECYRQPSNIQ